MGDHTPDMSAPPTPSPLNDAAWVSTDAPPTLTAGATFSAQVTMRNTGRALWSRAAGYYLGSEDPRDNFVWGTNRGLLDPSAEVAPGETATFRLTLTAPAAPGTYTMRWQALQDAVEWFGDASPPHTIEVTPADEAPWESVTEEALRAWRGAIATTLAPIPCGPRPGASDNALFTAQYDTACWSDADRAAARAAYRAHGYTHWAMGPIVQRGYHAQYPDTDWRANPDGFLDRVQELWREGFYPAIFLLPDTGDCANGSSIDRDCVERVLTPIYSAPRFQRLARLVVLAWEPEYTADDWQWGAQWMARVFPNALRYIHFPSGHAAPGLGSELEPNGPYATEGAMWVPVAPLIHGFLMQSTWTFGGATDEGRTPLEQFDYDLWDMVRRLRDGYAGWPTRGAGGRPVDVVAFEYASYYCAADGSRGTPAEVAAMARAWGARALMVDGVVGFGDGGL